ncbi:hypothetical protein N7534_008304 [Penicillium rubens]|nr:hypothetical protein N7524_003660 [Penicillium chrysogenum]KAJ5848986.1 hypothetical protein N7534_008304 [Penicillium rubens]
MPSLRSLWRRNRAEYVTSEHVPRTDFPSGIKLVCDPDDRVIRNCNGELIGSPGDGTIDIIFVHGLKGDREVTWTAPDATDPWSKTLLPGIFPAARILTFGYDPSVPKSQGVMPEDIVAKHAHDLLESLSSSRKKEDGTALDMAGQRTELDLTNIFRSVRGIIFIDPPNHESGNASWTDNAFSSLGFVKDPNYINTTLLDAYSKDFVGVERRFHEMVAARSAGGQPPIKIAYFYEKTLKSEVSLLVNLDRTQIDMSEFANADAPGFMAVCEELRWCLANENANKTSQVDIPANQARLDSQYHHNQRQYNPGNAKQTIVVGGDYFKTRGNQNFYQRDVPQPPPYSM